MKKITSKIYIALVFIFLYAPIFVLIANSFNKSKSRTVWTASLSTCTASCSITTSF